MMIRDQGLGTYLYFYIIILDGIKYYLKYI